MLDKNVWGGGRMIDLRWLKECIECNEPPQTNLGIDGRCVGCMAHEIEDLV